jgi:AcrR family transcriptional regulator
MKRPVSNIRERLLREALHAFTAKGYSASSVREIVEKCSVTKPTLYYYFGSKERLYRTLIAETFAEFNRRIAAIAASPLPPVEKLAAVMEHYLSHARENPDRIRLIMAALYRSDAFAPEVDIRLHILPNLRVIAGIIGEGMRDGLFRKENPLRLCLQLMGILHPQMLMRLLPRRRLPASSPREIMRTFVEGIGKR